MLVRFVSWNLNGFAPKGQAELLAAAEWDLCAMQEATTESAFDALAEQVGATGACARGLLDEDADARARYVSGLLARGPWRLGPSAVLDVPSPERTLHAVATRDDAALTVASLALPPASSDAWGPGPKVEQAVGIARWLKALDGPVVVGIDANTPRVDHPDLARTAFWNDGEDRLLGAQREHELRDVYRELVERDPARAAQVRADRPDGPLAVSYVRGRGERAADCRYDSILASPGIAIRDAGYRWEDARAAGSDHALVWADLDLPGA